MYASKPSTKSNEDIVIKYSTSPPPPSLQTTENASIPKSNNALRVESGSKIAPPVPPKHVKPINFRNQLEQTIQPKSNDTTIEFQNGPHLSTSPKSYTMPVLPEIVIQDLAKQQQHKQQGKKLPPVPPRKPETIHRNITHSSPPRLTNTHENLNGVVTHSLPNQLGEQYPPNHNDKKTVDPHPKRTKIVQEILSTERTYLASLDLIIGSWLIPLRSAIQAKDPIVAEKHMRQLFGNIEELYSVNSDLLLKLEKALESWSETQLIGDIFVEMEPRLKQSYVPFVYGHKKAILTVNKYHKKHDWISFCEKAIKASSSKLELLGLLIQPVQRIPRYKLLLEDLKKHTPEDHPDYQNICEACEKIISIAEEVDGQMNQQESLMKIYQIQKNFISSPKNLLTPDRKFIREGPLIKICRKEPKKRWFFLFNDALVYASVVQLGGDKESKQSFYREKAGHHHYKFHRMIPFDGKVALKDKIPTADIPYAFDIISEGKSFTVVCQTELEKDIWMKDLQIQLAGGRDDCVKVQETGQTNVDDDIGAPVWIPDDNAPKCQMCNKTFTFVIRRHHCRNCGKVICGACSSQKRLLAKLNKGHPVRVCDFCYDYLGLKEGDVIINEETPPDVNKKELAKSKTKGITRLKRKQSIAQELEKPAATELLWRGDRRNRDAVDSHDIFDLSASSSSAFLDKKAPHKQSKFQTLEVTRRTRRSLSSPTLMVGSSEKTELLVDRVSGGAATGSQSRELDDIDDQRLACSSPGSKPRTKHKTRRKKQEGAAKKRTAKKIGKKVKRRGGTVIESVRGSSSQKEFAQSDASVFTSRTKPSDDLFVYRKKMKHNSYSTP